MLKSLRSQIIFVIIVLISVLILQAVLNRIGQDILIQNQATTIQSLKGVEVARTLERDVMNLQRNVLIFKDTASRSSVSNFEVILESVYRGLDRFKKELTHQENRERVQDLTTRMRSHLKSYHEHFEHVIQGRTEQATVLNDHLNKSFDYLITEIREGAPQHNPHLNSHTFPNAITENDPAQSIAHMNLTECISHDTSDHLLYLT